MYNNALRDTRPSLGHSFCLFNLPSPPLILFPSLMEQQGLEVSYCQMLSVGPDACMCRLKRQKQGLHSDFPICSSFVQFSAPIGEVAVSIPVRHCS